MVHITKSHESAGYSQHLRPYTCILPWSFKHAVTENNTNAIHLKLVTDLCLTTTF